MARQIAEAEAQVATFRRLSDPLPAREVPQFQRSLDALLSLPKMRAQMKDMEA